MNGLCQMKIRQAHFAARQRKDVVMNRAELIERLYQHHKESLFDEGDCDLPELYEEIESLNALYGVTCSTHRQRLTISEVLLFAANDYMGQVHQKLDFSQDRKLEVLPIIAKIIALNPDLFPGEVFSLSDAWELTSEYLSYFIDYIWMQELKESEDNYARN